MAVIWKATEKEQSKRYQTALDFKQAIQNALIPDPPLMDIIKEWIEDNVAYVSLGVVAFLAIVFILVMLI